MRRFSRAVAVAAVLALAPLLAGCSDFDMDKLDVFGLNKKKPLPGDRKPLFPEGVPGVQQGVPPDLMKGYQPPAEPTQAELDQKAAEAAVADEAKPKPRPKPKPRTRVMVAPKPAQQPTDQSGWPAPQEQQAQQPQGQAAQSGWPDPRQQQQQPQQQQPQAAWPAPPPTGTFSR